MLDLDIELTLKAPVVVLYIIVHLQRLTFLQLMS